MRKEVTKLAKGRIPILTQDLEVDTSSFTGRQRRHLVTVRLGAASSYTAFVPPPLPTSVDLSEEAIALLSDADRALGELNGVSRLISNVNLLVAPFMRREAVLSSRIEGTEASLTDVLAMEAGASERVRVRRDDTQEVVNYVRSMEYGIERLSDLPMSLRLVRELHERLLRDIRGNYSTPGQFRTSQNWIGEPGCTLNEATFVPPPADQMLDCLTAWELFLHADDLSMPPLVQCALMHYQFEAIHPFLDGNGRVGRLLISLFLVHRNIIRFPLLTLSGFFHEHRSSYLDELLHCSQTGEFEPWVRFFLRATREQARHAADMAGRVADLHSDFRARLHAVGATPTAHTLLERLMEMPVTTGPRITELLDVTLPTAYRALEALEQANIVEEITGHQRNRIWAVGELMNVLEASPEPALRS